MTRITFSLPSIYPPALLRALNNIQDTTRCDYDIVLVSPFEPPPGHRNITWIKEEPADARGCNAGHALAYRHMQGEFLLAWVDDHLLADGWDVAALRNYEARERATGAKPFVLGLRHAWPFHVGTEFGIYYPYFPLVRRQYMDQVGWYDPAYKKGFADSDLALRIWQAGGRCEWSRDIAIVVHHDDDRKAGVVFDPADMQLFLHRWAPVYGAGWRTAKLRDFNMDVVPEDFAQLVTDNTFFHNKPEFREIALRGGWRE